MAIEGSPVNYNYPAGQVRPFLERWLFPAGTYVWEDGEQKTIWDKVIPPGLLLDYQELTETPSEDNAQRTKWNVRDCDAILTIIPESDGHSPGTEIGLEERKRLGKPMFTAAGMEDVSENVILPKNVRTPILELLLAKKAMRLLVMLTVLISRDDTNGRVWQQHGGCRGICGSRSSTGGNDGRW